MRHPRRTQASLLLGCTLVLAACDIAELKLADDPSSLAPTSAAVPWSREAAIAIPGGKTTLDAFAAQPQLPTPSIERRRVYDLAALIDLARRTNPSTRADWEAARAEAAKVGIAEGAYLPTISAATTASCPAQIEMSVISPI